MTKNETALERVAPGLLDLCNACLGLTERRIEIDQRLVAHPPGDSWRDVLWEELEALLIKLRAAVEQLAEVPAAQTAELSAKAAVLAAILRSGDAGTGPVVPEITVRALALAVADDVVRLLG